MVSYLGSLVQFSPATGEGGPLQTDMAVCGVGSTRSVPAMLGLPLLTGVRYPRLHCSGSQLLYMEQALC